MTVRVDSEVGRLRRVLVHRPGAEIDLMVPTMMEQLLFDDILDGKAARREHDMFTAVLAAAGVEVLQAGSLLVEAVESEPARRAVLASLEEHLAVPRELTARLARLPAAELAAALLHGRRRGRTGRGVWGRSFELPPVPNYFFQRDPQVVLGERVLISSMATAAREREPLLAAALFGHHPRLAGCGEILYVHPGMYERREDGRQYPQPRLEGGDVLVPSPEILLVGVSQRTSRLGAETLAARLAEAGWPYRHLLVVELPPRRSYMHLDTVFTFIDHDACLAYMPVIDGSGPEAALVYRVEIDGGRLTYRRCPPLLATLAELGMELEVVPCGGGRDLIDQEREQWTDGANAFAVAPGVILLYQRNRRTVRELADRGWRVLSERQAVAGDEPLLDAGRTVITFRGHELSRARGGPRCMTMPVERAPLPDRPSAAGGGEEPR